MANCWNILTSGQRLREQLVHYALDHLAIEAASLNMTDPINPSNAEAIFSSKAQGCKDF